jgi:ABC-type multidrug transport system fused ATPase/permease subunit
LIDDPLSAVDNATARHLISNALSGDLVQDRTVILTTHQVKLCAPLAKQIVLLEDGRIAKVSDAARLDPSEVAALDCLGGTRPERAGDASSLSKEDVLEKPTATNPVRELVKAEERNAGLTGRRHLFRLLKTAGGIGFWVPLVVIFFITEYIGIAHSAWLARWTLQPSRDNDKYYASISISLTTARGLLMFVRSALMIFAFTWRASAVVHHRLLSALLRAPLQTLQAIPSGRILNRFTTDMERFDMDLADTTQTTLKMSIGTLVMLQATAVEVPQILWVVLALMPVFYHLQGRLAKFRSDARKLNSVWSSPLLTMMNDSQRAVTLMRAFGSPVASEARMRLLQTQQRIAGLTEFAAWLLCR